MSDRSITTTTPSGAILPDELTTTIDVWSKTTTHEGDRSKDLLHDKVRAVTGFFQFVGKGPKEVKPDDVRAFLVSLEERKPPLARSTIYGVLSKVSSFYRWALLPNPVDPVRPTTPKPYQSESTKSLDDDQVTQLLSYVKSLGDGGNVTAKRDYALLLIYFLSGARREEIARLTWGDLRFNGSVFFTIVRKGGERVNIELASPMVKAAVLDYLTFSGRLSGMTRETPLWIRHDRGSHGEGVTSHGISKALKMYAAAVGIPEFHMHQTRHTFARVVADESGSLVTTQEELGHKSQATTRVYVQAVGTKRDKFSGILAERFGVK